MALKRFVSRATGGLEHLLSLVLLAAAFVLAPQDWSFLKTLLAAGVLVAIYEVTLAIRERWLNR